jgi:hypothetical protein
LFYSCFFGSCGFISSLPPTCLGLKGLVVVVVVVVNQIVRSINILPRPMRIPFLGQRLRWQVKNYSPRLKFIYRLVTQIGHWLPSAYLVCVVLHACEASGTWYPAQRICHHVLLFLFPFSVELQACN